MIKLLNTASGQSMSGSFSLTIGAGRGEKRLLIASIAMWAGAQPTQTASFNSATGTLLFVSTNAPAYLAMYYWLDDKLPPPGAYSYAGTSNADAAVTLFLFGGVDQNAPIFAPKWDFNSNSGHPTTTEQMQSATFASLCALGSNTVSADAPLGGFASLQQANAKISTAWAPQKISSPGFTTTGDGRTTIGAIALKAYEYPRVPLARLLSRRVSPALRWWHGA